MTIYRMHSLAVSCLLLLLVFGVLLPSRECFRLARLPALLQYSHHTAASPSIASRHRGSHVMLSVTSLTADLQSPTPPQTEKARLQVTLTGQHASHPLFRAELKKELTFFRGCSAHFYEIDSTISTVIAEGKTGQLLRFLGWLQVYGQELRLRKPNFQGPSLTVHIQTMTWSEHKGEIHGFKANKGAPLLNNVIVSTAEEATMDARAMAGTDESV